MMIHKMATKITHLIIHKMKFKFLPFEALCLTFYAMFIHPCSQAAAKTDSTPRLEKQVSISPKESKPEVPGDSQKTKNPKNQIVKNDGAAPAGKASVFHFEAKGKWATVIISEHPKEFQFQVRANEGLSVSVDAPWNLKISEISGIKFQRTQFEKKDFDPSLPGFEAESQKSEGPIKFVYSLTAFICLADKTQCYREVLKGNAQSGI